jgi:DHA1 family multidrug resistance protein-like MFS transporter
VGGIAFAIFTPIWGAVGDRYGRKLMLVRAMIATSIILCLMAFTRTPGQLMVLRFIQGCVTGTPAAASALVAMSAPKQRLAYSLGLLQTGLFVGNSLGPMIGGYIGDTWGFHATFFVSSAIVAAALVVVLVLVREPEAAQAAAAQARRESPLKSFGALLSSPAMLVLIGLGFIANATSSITGPVLPLYIQQLVGNQGRLASTAGTISGIVALAAAVSAMVVGRLSDRVGYRQALLLCSAGTALLFFPQAMAGTILALGVWLTAQGLFRGGLGPNISAMVVARAPQEKTGAALGLSSSAASAGFAVGPMLGAAVLAMSDIRSVYVVAGVTFTLVTLAILFVGKRSGQPQGAAS